MTVRSMPEHNTRARYYRGCHCKPCTTANRQYERERVAKRRHGAPAYRSAGPAREHINALRAAGVGLKTIAKVSGVSHGGLSKLIYGDRARDRGPSKRIRPETHDRIMAVTVHAAADGARLDATETWRLIDEMTDAGVPKAAIAAELGQAGPGLQLSRSLIAARNARRVADIHHQWMTGDLELYRRDRHGGARLIDPPEDRPTPTATAQNHGAVSALLDKIADAVTAREEPWRSRAQCRHHPTWVFFPDRGDTQSLEAARRICETCPVQAECAATAATEPHGVWAGTTPHTRTEIAA